MRLILTTIAFVMLPATAMAYQTEVDQGTMEWKREAKVRWDREQERLRIQAAKEAAAAAEAAEAERTLSARTDTATPTAPPSYSGGVLSAEQVAGYARGAGFPESVIPTMVSIAFRESRFNPAAINPTSGACGLWQMYPCPGPHALDPATNAAMAFAKYQARGLSPWGY